MVSNEESEGPTMSTPITRTEARLALDSIEHRRQQVLSEIDVPPWYWAAVAAGWVALGVIADYGPVWATIAGTLLFGAVHSAVAPRVVSGRRRSSQLTIRGDLVSRRIPQVVIGFLIVMTAATVVFALLLNADGARHPAALAGGAVGLLVLASGPALMAMLRRQSKCG
jgi:hypothetical protein